MDDLYAQQQHSNVFLHALLICTCVSTQWKPQSLHLTGPLDRFEIYFRDKTNLKIVYGDKGMERWFKQINEAILLLIEQNG